MSAHEELKIMDEVFATAFAKKDVGTIANLYADDAIAINIGEPSVSKSKSEIQSVLETLFNTMEFQSFEIVEEHRKIFGDVAFTLTLTKTKVALPSGESMELTIRGLDVRQKMADGSWKVVADHTSVPAH
jgi:uncharacterized protein (TIGR02246 family)